MKNTSRRKFILSSAIVGAGSLIIEPSLNKLFAVDKNNAVAEAFKQDPLEYAYNALEPSIDALTMEIHYTKHAATYCKNLNEAAHDEKVEGKPIEDILKNISKFSMKMRNNAGGHYNHELFWKSLTPKTDSKPSGKLSEAIAKSFGSVDALKAKFNDAAKGRFGSGWAWLVADNDKKLVISSTPNQDSPLMDIAEVKGTPVFGLDVWEHAYYLKYQNKRADYIHSFWKVLNWDFASERFAKL
jgi:superoxide dismutase, Fe-Mn family